MASLGFKIFLSRFSKFYFENNLNSKSKEYMKKKKMLFVVLFLHLNKFGFPKILIDIENV